MNLRFEMFTSSDIILICLKRLSLVSSTTITEIINLFFIIYSNSENKFNKSLKDKGVKT